MTEDTRSITPTELPVWIWLPDLQRYRDLTTGRFASEPEVMEWVATSIRGSSVVTDTLTQQLAQRQLRLGAWQRLMRQEIKDEYIRQYLLGRGGLEQMTQVDWGSIGGMLKEQYGWLDKFVAEIEMGRLSEGGPGSGHQRRPGCRSSNLRSRIKGDDVQAPCGQLPGEVEAVTSGIQRPAVATQPVAVNGLVVNLQ